MERAVEDAARASIPMKTAGAPFVWRPSPYLKNLIRERRRIRRIFYQNRDPHCLQLRNALTREISRQMVSEKRDAWNRLTASFDHRSMARAWRIFGAMRGKKAGSDGRPLRAGIVNGRPTFHRSDQEKADAFASHLDGVFREQDSVHFNQRWRHQVDLDLRRYRDRIKVREDRPTALVNGIPVFAALPDDNHPVAVPITIVELQSAIKRTKNKAAGKDDIPAICYKRAPPPFLALILALFNAVLEIGYHPRRWKEGRIVMIPKPGKDPHEVKSYRPITLLPILGKIFERVMKTRLVAEMEAHGAISEFQSGCRPRRSTSDHLFRLGQVAMATRVRGQFTTVAFMDMEKAFDSVWHGGLLHKVITQFRARIPTKASRWIASFLADRRFEVRVGSALSQQRTPTAGTPQGAVISPFLYTLFTTDMPLVEDNTLSGSQYVDDVAIWCTDPTHPVRAAIRLQRALDAFTQYCDKWRIKLNAAKTQLLVIKKEQKFRAQFRGRFIRLTLHGEEIVPSRTAKFLGVTFDHGANFGAHINDVCVRLAQRTNILRSLGGEHWGACPQLKLRLYLQAIRPVLEYGCAAWCGAAKSHLAKLQARQNISLRACLNMPWYAPTDWLHQLSGLPLVEDLLRTRVRNFLDRAQIRGLMLVDAAADIRGGPHTYVQLPSDFAS
jgi:hypothetical protein